MSRIQVGMMVRVVDFPGWKSQKMRFAIGKVARVAGYGDKGCYWLLDGLQHHPKTWALMNFHEDGLEPINPDSGPSTWEEVESITGWCPRETVKQ